MDRLLLESVQEELGVADAVRDTAFIISTHLFGFIGKYDRQKVDNGVYKNVFKWSEPFQNEKINVPVLGIIENMAWFTPAELPDNRYYIFGQDGGKKLAEELNVPLLGQIPLVQSVREAGDNGMPIALQEGHPAAALFDKICQALQN